MEELSNDYELDNIENEEYEEDEDEEEYEQNSSFLSKSTKRKLSTDSGSKYGKKRKCRTTFSKSQLNALENEFLNSNFISNDRIDLIIESTGLDSRIIKNWFKNKRSRVLADTKTNPPGATAKACIENLQILTNSPALNSNSELSKHTQSTYLNSCNNQQAPTATDIPLQQQQQNQLFIQTSNLNSNYKENRINDQTAPLRYHQPLYNQQLQPNINYYAETTVKAQSTIEKLSNNKDLQTKNSEPIIDRGFANNKNMKGLLNIIHKSNFKKETLVHRISTSVKNNPNSNQNANPTKSMKKSKKKLEKKHEEMPGACKDCLIFSKLFCKCNVSKEALSKLYSHVNGINGQFLLGESLQSGSDTQTQQPNLTAQDTIDVTCVKTFEIL